MRRMSIELSIGLQDFLHGRQSKLQKSRREDQRNEKTFNLIITEIIKNGTRF